MSHSSAPSPSAPQADRATGSVPDSGSAISGATPSAAVQLTRVLAVGSLLGLVVLGLAWEMWLAPVRPGGSLLALKVLPLCIPLAGLLKHRMYTYRWLSLLVWLYFTEGVVRAWSDRYPGNVLAMVEIALCLVLFVACALHVRLRLRAPREAAVVSGA